MVEPDARAASPDTGRGPAPDAGVPPRSSDAGGPPPTSCAPGPEDDRIACTDACSNDGDPYIDCEDRDCCGVVECPLSTFCGSSSDAGGPECAFGAENTPSLCSDGCSNDDDPFIDCEDYDCCDVVACPASSACGMRGPPTTSAHVSRDASDCVGTGTVSYLFDRTTYDVVTVAFATSTGYQVFGYTRGTITSGPFPLTGMAAERQVRVADLGSGLQMALSRWGGSEWTDSEGGDATFSDDATVSLASDAEALYPTHACVGVVEGSATTGVFGGVDYMSFEFTAPVIGATPDAQEGRPWNRRTIRGTPAACATWNGGGGYRPRPRPK